MTPYNIIAYVQYYIQHYIIQQHMHSILLYNSICIVLYIALCYNSICIVLCIALALYYSIIYSIILFIQFICILYYTIAYVQYHMQHYIIQHLHSIHTDAAARKRQKPSNIIRQIDRQIHVSSIPICHESCLLYVMSHVSIDRRSIDRSIYLSIYKEINGSIYLSIYL